MILPSERFILIGLLLVSFSGSHAQMLLRAPDGSPVKTVTYISPLDLMNNPTEEKAEGTPYFSDVFAKGNVYSVMGTLKGVNLKYNIFADRFEYEERDSTFAFYPSEVIHKIEFGGRTFVPGKYELRDKVIDGYLALVEVGEVSLLVKMLVALKPAVEAKPMQDPTPPKFIRMPDSYYFKIGTGSLVKVLNIKKVIERLPDHKKEMEAYAKKEKISPKDADDLTMFVKYYNSLQ